MTSANPPTSVEDLVALNNEIAALMRAGIPLELGLAHIGEDSTGGLGPLADRLRDRLDEGKSLDAALEAEGAELPPMYGSVVRAGLRSGRLSEALESMSSWATLLLELRRKISYSLIYPVIVFVLAYGLFVFFIAAAAPRLGVIFESLDIPQDGAISVFNWLSSNLAVWVAVPPGLLAIGTIWWLATRHRLLQPVGIGSWRGLMRHMPGMRRLFRELDFACFSASLAMLVKHEVPLTVALPMAADATGNPRLSADALRIAQELQQGRSLSQALKTKSGFSRFMNWMMNAGQEQGAFAATMSQLAEFYRRRVTARADWIGRLAPVVLVVVIGGGAVACYGLTIFVPMIEILRNVGSN